ncbi:MULTISPECIES: DNA/RNA nuclease SfsA [unclassified Synechocystis]|uniref:DNA/RNA nuclease SfsA n=1 Tax=unclassified Synechocystis TaxID=2640012 RepID=UPI00048F4699|nr:MULTISPECIES: DNA/RNA nuclease SfsA [unclassified Synechocystis]AIE74318.1 Sugar/maltose fermentation stimulation protein [Synechocystis sp. PCC 6714]MCT0254898.1 DNA/RNA nuclease SfsA [Synechocystis sp. CS-94]
MDFFYSYPPLIAGTLVKRYKRFLADVELDSGEVITAHCPNTGPMTGVCQIGAKVYLSQSDNPKRKLAYTWEMIEVDNTWVGVNTGLPNRAIKQALNERIFPNLREDYDNIKPEVVYGKDKKSRIDFLLTKPAQKPVYVEVKNTTLAKENLALFPDTETTRGQKHLQELMDILPEAQAVMLYFINRGDCTHFSPGDAYDRRYGELLRQAIGAGVEVMPCRFEVSPEGVKFLGMAELVL